MDEEQEHVERAEPGVSHQFDEPYDEQDRHRVVQARLALEGSSEPLAELRAAKQREDRGAVGRGQDRAKQEGLENRQVKQQERRQPCDGRRGGCADQGEPDGWTQYGADLRVAGGQPGLEEDRRQSDRAN